MLVYRTKIWGLIFYFFASNSTTFKFQIVRCRVGFNFINILHDIFSYERALRSFSLITVWLSNFLAQKLAQKLLVKCWWNWLWVYSLMITSRQLPPVSKTLFCFPLFFFTIKLHVSLAICGGFVILKNYQLKTPKPKF